MSLLLTLYLDTTLYLARNGVEMLANYTVVYNTSDVSSLLAPIHFGMVNYVLTIKPDVSFYPVVPLVGSRLTEIFIYVGTSDVYESIALIFIVHSF